MSTSTLGLFLRHLALSEEVDRLGTVGDHTLLAAYESESGQDALSQAAFTELMRRHGPMVLRTCRRVLGRCPDAEDAFQATFVLLARKAGSISKREALSSWLHRVAYRTALTVLRNEVCRRTHERQVSVMTHPDPDPAAEASWNEIRPILDAELDALPDGSRRLLIACYLQGKTYIEAAAELGLPPGSIGRHLQRARTLLAKRLARRGITVSAVLLAILLEDAAKGAGVPAVLMVHTLEAARMFTEQATGIVSETVAHLVTRGLAQMKSSTHFGIWLAGWVSLVGVGLIACQTLKAWPDKTPDSEPPAAGERPAQERDKPARTDCFGDPLPPGALARLGTLRLRYRPPACPPVFTPDGKGLLAGGGVHLPKLWDVATGKLIREFNNIPKQQFVSCVILSPDGRLLGVRSRQNDNLYILETATGKRLHEFKDQVPYKHGYHDFAFSPDSKAIADLLDGRLELRDVATGRTLWQKNEDDIISLAFAPDGKILASASKSRAIVRLWDARTGEHLRELAHEGWQPRQIAFSPDSRTLVVDSIERREKPRPPSDPLCDRPWCSHLLDVATGKKVWQLGEQRATSNTSVFSPDGTSSAFSPDGKIVAIPGDDEAIHLWDAATGKELRRCPNAGRADSVAFSPDGKVLAAHAGLFVRFWDVASGKEQLPSRLPPGHENGVSFVAFAADGKTLTSVGQDHTIRWWDTWTGRQRLCLPCIGNHNQVGYYVKAALSADGTILALTDKEDLERSPTSIRLYDAATGKELRRLDGGGPPDTKGYGQLAFSPDGKLLAQVFSSLLTPNGQVSRPKVRLWDVVSGKRYEHELDGMYPVFSPCSRFIATVPEKVGDTDQVIRFWEAATGKKIDAISMSDHNKEQICCLALSPDGQTLATASLNKIILYRLSWNKRSGVCLSPPCLVAVNSSRWYCPDALVFSPDGRMLASVGRTDKYTVQVWEVASGKERALFEGHFRRGMALAFSADSRRLASDSGDTTILIWDITGRMREDGRLRSARLSENEFNILWADLAGGDSVRAGRAIWKLVAAGPQAVSLLGERLRPVKGVSPEVIARLIADLDADSFQVRDKSQRELEKLGEQCETALRQALAKQPSLELRRRLQELLSPLEKVWKPLSGDELRVVRVVEVLEQVGTSEARRVLEGWSHGAPGARLTAEAQAALGRLDRKQSR